jgi:hypothetical protein
MATKRIEFPAFLLPGRVKPGDRITINAEHLFLPARQMEIEIIEMRTHTAIIAYNEEP